MSQCSSVRSDPGPQPGQNHRSSGNFSTEGCTSTLRWSMPDGVTVDIMRDKSVGKDPVELSGVKNGDVTDNPNQRALYVANPSGATSQFTVASENVA